MGLKELLFGQTFSISGGPGSRRGHCPEEDSLMKSIRVRASLFVTALALVGLLFLAVPNLVAQQDGPPSTGSPDDTFNPPPCDFSNQFYADNGIDVTQLIGRFGDNNGTTRLTGPPARGNQVNYKADPSCSQRDPDHRNFRILATTGGNSDDNNSPFTCSSAGQGPSASPNCANQSILEPETFEFISILAFMNSQAAFAQGPYDRNVGFINGGLEGVQQNPGEDVSYGANVNVNGTVVGEAPGQTLRGFAMQDIVSNFEAYGAISQFKKSLNCPANATPPFTAQNCRPVPTQFSANPCSLGMIQNLQNPGATSIPQPCFQVADGTVNGQPLSDVASPNNRQDWRFATNRNSMDGSDTNDPTGTLTGAVINAPFGYFCDDLLGMWIITYFWFTQPPNTQLEPCKDIYAAIGAKNGFNLDGTPIILTAFELNDELEANGCGAEGQEDPGGSDGGAGWLICPAIPDPRAGAIASDAFLDQTFLPNGFPQNLALTANFLCLQIFGQFCNVNVSLQNRGINPSPTKVGTDTNVTTLFQNTTNATLTGVTLTASIVNSSGNIVATKSSTGNTLAPGQTNNVTIVWSPTAKGTYTVQGTASNSSTTAAGANSVVAVATVN